MAGKYSHEQWISLAKEKYPEEFDYNQTIYIDSYHKVLIRCKEHDYLFEVDPSRFLTTQINNCPECKVNRLTEENFIIRAKKRHPFLDFSKAKYRTYIDNVIVLCPKHGEFSKQAKHILNGQGNICPGCIKEIQEQVIDRYIYYLNSDKGLEPGVFYKLKITHKQSKLEFIKIGITPTTIVDKYKDKRYKDFDFEVLDEVHTTNLEAALLEKEYKNVNKENRFFLPKDVWFDGSTEFYEFDGYHQLLHSQVKFIRNAILEKQGGICPLCDNEVIMPTLDHYHSKKQYGSGLVRGVICNTCNRIAGVIENNLLRNNIAYSDAPKVLRNIADYLLNSRTRYIHPSEKPKAPRLKKSSYNKLIKAVSGKQKIPAYSGKFTKKIEQLFVKYGVDPEFY